MTPHEYLTKVAPITAFEHIVQAVRAGCQRCANYLGSKPDQPLPQCLSPHLVRRGRGDLRAVILPRRANIGWKHGPPRVPAKPVALLNGEKQVSATSSPSCLFSCRAADDRGHRRHRPLTARVRDFARGEARFLAARAIVDRYTELNLPAYGLTTGLGAGVDTRLATDDLIAFQLRVPQARAVGVGPALPRESVRAMMAARIAGMAAGGSGVSLTSSRG